MGITELKAMMGDNNEALAEITEIEGTMTKNTGRIMDLETEIGASGQKLTEAIMSRDKIKGVIRDELGIDEFSADAVRTKLSTYASDDAIAARDKQFNELKVTSASKIEEMEGKLRAGTADRNTLRLKLAISKTDVMGQTKGEHANDMLLQWIAEDASFDDEGNIQYKGSSGETIFNQDSNPLTLEDRINEIKGDQSRDFVFQQRFLNGGGAPTDKVITGPSGNTAGGKFTRTTMSNQEKSDYRTKYGDAAYSKLPML